jgi:hypothetical protein
MMVIRSKRLNRVLPNYLEFYSKEEQERPQILCDPAELSVGKSVKEASNGDSPVVGRSATVGTGRSGDVRVLHDKKRAIQSRSLFRN